MLESGLISAACRHTPVRTFDPRTIRLAPLAALTWFACSAPNPFKHSYLYVRLGVALFTNASSTPRLSIINFLFLWLQVLIKQCNYFYSFFSSALYFYLISKWIICWHCILAHSPVFKHAVSLIVILFHRHFVPSALFHTHENRTELINILRK